jgi:hypothetical protein
MPSASFVVNLTESVHLSNYEPSAAMLVNRCAREHQSLLLVYTWRAANVDVLPALSQAAVLDCPLDLLGVEDGE